MITGIIIGVVVVSILLILALSYVKAPPDVAYVISGVMNKPRILIGRAGFKIPFFERLDKLALGAVQIDVKTASAVPTAAPLTNVDKITMYGDGNQAKLVGDVMKTADQVMSSLTEATGIDIKSIIAGYLGGKIS